MKAIVFPGDRRAEVRDAAFVFEFDLVVQTSARSLS